MLTERSHYEDVTMEFFDRPAIDLTGRSAIVDFWRTSSVDSGTSKIDYEVLKRFVAGPTVILDLRGRVTVAGEYWGLKSESITLVFDQITVLRIVDGMVSHHVDHVDYAAGMAQIEELRRRQAKHP